MGKQILFLRILDIPLVSRTLSTMTEWKHNTKFNFVLSSVDFPLREKCPKFPAFELNTGKYGPEKTPYLDTFHTVPHNFLKARILGTN